jgi:hypothetical protein
MKLQGNLYAHQKCKCISWRPEIFQWINYCMDIPSGFWDQKIPLSKYSWQSQTFFELQKSLENIKPNPFTLQIRKLRLEFFTAWRNPDLSTHGRKKKKGLQASFKMYLDCNCYIFLKASPPAPSLWSPKDTERRKFTVFTEMEVAWEAECGLCNSGGWCTISLIPFHWQCLLECLKI